MSTANGSKKTEVEVKQLRKRAVLIAAGHADPEILRQAFKAAVDRGAKNGARKSKDPQL
ncbi:hypothetical protein [Cytobacillus praedii]|uniref:hypothetical protein n=1 Tax=Cytobacillus praedii TaxID=1742358 RepID=UPI002E1E9157|nr:hypothetical protein [Cytobacillus praedii]